MNINDRNAANYAMRITIWMACAVLFLKAVAYIYTTSAAILADMAESIVHIFAILFAAYGLYKSKEISTGSKSYRFSKISKLSSGFESYIVMIAGLMTLALSIYKWSAHSTVSDIEKGSLLITAAALINGLLGVYLLHVGKKNRSLILQSNGKHVLTDCYTSVAVLVGLLLYSFTGLYWIDPLCGVFLSFSIVISGAQLLSRTSEASKDKADPLITGQLIEVLSQRCAYYGIQFHGLCHERDNERHYVDLHLLFPATTPIGEAHHIASEIEVTLISTLSNRAHILIHLESMEELVANGKRK